MISIIIPACNEGRYISATINSIKKQSFKDYETIVVCDGCTDNTAKVSKKIADKVVILKKRQGPGVAKNKGVEVAKGNILVFLDADTHFTSNILENINKIDDSIIGTARIKPSNNKFKHKFMMFLKNNILCNFGVSNGIIFCTRKSFDSINGFQSIQKREDGFFVRRLMKEGHKFLMIKDYVVSSTRRFDRKGYIGVILYWIKEAVKPSTEYYEVIR